MKRMQFVIIILLTLSLSACAGRHRPPEELPPMDEELLTTITPSGLKIFTYTAKMAGPRGQRGGGGMPPGGGGPPPGGGGGGGPGGGGPGRDNGFKQMIEEKLTAKLTETGFCREGYIELGSSIDMGESYIRGECQEGATEEDRAHFSNTAKYTN